MNIPDHFFSFPSNPFIFFNCFYIKLAFSLFLYDTFCYFSLYRFFFNILYRNIPLNQQFHCQKFIQCITSYSFTIVIPFEFWKDLSSWCKDVKRCFLLVFFLISFFKNIEILETFGILKRKVGIQMVAFYLFPRSLFQYHFLNKPFFSWFEMLCVLCIKFPYVLFFFFNRLFRSDEDHQGYTSLG